MDLTLIHSLLAQPITTPNYIKLITDEMSRLGFAHTIDPLLGRVEFFKDGHRWASSTITLEGSVKIAAQLALQGASKLAWAEVKSSNQGTQSPQSTTQVTVCQSQPLPPYVTKEQE